MNKKETKSGAPFYIALCCCVAVIGLVGYVGRIASQKESADNVSNASAQIQAAETAGPIVTPVESQPPTAAPKSENKKSYVQTSAKMKQPTEPPKDESKKEEIKPEPKAPEFSLPCKGTVIKPMSADLLEYNTVLGDWRTHNGVDIALDTDENVTAVHSGVVTEMFDGAMGETVIVDCKNGFTAVYACLSETDCVSVGSEISSGDVIGKAGTAGSENVQDAHLHLELIKDGEYVNPCDYIKFNS